MLEMLGVVVGIEEDLESPVTHTIKMTNVTLIQGDMCAGEERQLLFLSNIESRRLAALMPEGYMEGKREFEWWQDWRQQKVEPADDDEGVLYCRQEIPGITGTELNGLRRVCDGVTTSAAKKLAQLLGGECEIKEGLMFQEGHDSCAECGLWSPNHAPNCGSRGA
jgi:hypothetical protein